MEQFVKLFLQLVDIGYQAGIAVLFVLAARAFLTMIGAPKKYSCMLGLLPFVRLAFPIRLESIFSLLPKQSNPGTSIAMLVSEPVPYVSSENVIRSEAPVMPAVNLPEAAKAQFPDWISILAFLWLAGVLAFGLFGLFSVWRLKRKLRMSVRLKDNIYLADGIPSAFVLGVFRPKIYLPSDIDGQSKRYVIAHERAHIRRKDYIGKLAVYCLLCIYWMNPVLWIGYYYFRKDMELACDEMVIGRQDESYRRSYAEALLKLSVSQKGFSKIPLAFAEESPKERIEKVIDYRKPKLVAAVIGVLLLIALAVGLLTNPVKEEKELQTSTNGTTEEMYANTENTYTNTEETYINTEETNITTEEAPEDTVQVKTPVADSGAAVNQDVPDVSEGSTHREGFQAPKLHYYTPKSVAYAYEQEEALDEKATEALRELYDLTGYQIEECYYYCMGSMSTFCFGMTEDDLERDRVFLSRRYDEIESIDIASRRRVWYSPVDMIIYPEGYDTMTEKEKAIWFVTHSGMYNGQQPADAYQPYDWDSNIWHVVMADDTAYEVMLDSGADIVDNIYGPYPTSDIRH